MGGKRTVPVGLKAGSSAPTCCLCSYLLQIDGLLANGTGTERGPPKLKLQGRRENL